MDETDEKILELIRYNARMSYQEIADNVELSRVAVKKRIQKLEEAGIIRQYVTTIHREHEITAVIDIDTHPRRIDKVIKYVSTKFPYVRQVFKTSRPDHIHIIAVSDSAPELQLMIRTIQKDCRKDIDKFSGFTINEIAKDVYAGIYPEEDDQENAQADNP